MRYAIVKNGVVTHVVESAGGPPFAPDSEDRTAIPIGGREIEIGMTKADLDAALLSPEKPAKVHASPEPEEEQVRKPGRPKSK